jgi:hypothetical protein
VNDDAFDGATNCDVCGRESCEEHLPPPPDQGNGHDRHAAAVDRELELLRVRRDAKRRLAAEERGSVTPEIISLAQLLAEPEPEEQWRITDWQPQESRVILAAPHKGGKTTLVASLVRSLVDGDPWLDKYPVCPVPGCVALIDTEMSRRQLKRWYRDQGLRHPERVILVPLRGRAAAFDLLDPSCQQQWQQWLRDRAVCYLVLDCLRPILDALGLDESHDAGRLLVPFDVLLREANIPEACIVHHMGHSNERSRGDSRLRDWPDVELRLVREGDTPQRYLSAYGRDVDIPESLLGFDPLTRRVTFIGGSRAEARRVNEAEDPDLVKKPTKKPPVWRRMCDVLRPRPEPLWVIAQTIRARVETVDREVRRRPDLFQRVPGEDGVRRIALVEGRYT